MADEAEQRGYSRGYTAGRKRNDADCSRERAHRRREAFRRQVFLAILPELVRAPWKTGDKQWTNMQEFVDGAWKFAELASAKTTFSGERDDS